MASPVPDARLHALHTRLPTLALAYLTFVVYGSLVPLEVRQLDLAAAWQAFLAVPYLDLGIADRQDWVANGVLYLPLGLLLAAILSPDTRRPSRVAGGVLALFMAGAVALGVEFTQVFFANRSVSLNDLLAEVLGSAAGVLVWVFLGRRLLAATVQVQRGSTGAIGAALVLYLSVFVLLSLFPLDFLVSMEEIAWKWNTHPPRLLPAGEDCVSALHCTVKLPLAVVAMLPVGVLLALRDAGGRRTRSLAGLFGAAVCLALVIESLQFFTATGRSHGISVLAAGLGAPLGYAAARWLVAGGGLERLREHRTILLLLAVPLYVLALAWVNRLQLQAPLSLGEALERLAATRLVPFYYHYYGPESAALVSVVAAVAMYLPVGALVWAWRRPADGARAASLDAPAFWIATALAAAMWLGRLFLADFRFADPTNILIAGMAAMLGVGVSRVCANWLATAGGAAIEAAGSGPVSESHCRRDSLAGFVAIGLLILLLATHPLPQVVTPVCLFYAALLFTFPSAWLLVVPLAIPVFDLGDWTGWILVEEIDLVVLTTVAVLAIRRDRRRQPEPLSRGAKTLVALLALSYLLSALVGLLPLAPLDADAMADLYSPWNALRIARMFLLPLLLFPFLREALDSDPRAGDKLAAGMLLGLLATGAWVLWERYLFVGITDLQAHFRIAGPFSGMHVGGQQIDAYLAGTLPFAAWFAIRHARWPGRLLAVAAATVALYAVVVTFTRWTYLMTGASTLLLFATWVMARSNAGALRGRSVVAALMLTASGFAALTAVSFADTFMRQRLAWLEHDAQVRADHWAAVVSIYDTAVTSGLLGAGLGTYPRVWRQQLPEMEHSATYTHRRESKANYIRMDGGIPLYLDQRVLLSGAPPYRLRVVARAGPDDGRLQVGVCEKTVMYSRECAWLYFPLDAGDAWQSRESPLALDKVGAALDASLPWVRRPVFLTIVPPRGEAFVELSSVSLVDGQGRELLHNGDFSAGRDRWRYTSDEHILWHVKNLPLLLLFEQGWLGLLAVLAISALAVARLAAGLGKGRVEAAIVLTAFFGMWFIGATGSVMDSPRLGMLFYLLVFWSIAHPWRRIEDGDG